MTFGRSGKSVALPDRFRELERAGRALRIGRQTVSLPISAKWTDDEVQKVIAAVFRVLGKVEATGGSVMTDKIPLLRLSKPYPDLA